MENDNCLTSRSKICVRANVPQSEANVFIVHVFIGCLIGLQLASQTCGNPLCLAASNVGSGEASQDSLPRGISISPRSTRSKPAVTETLASGPLHLDEPTLAERVGKPRSCQ